MGNKHKKGKRMDNSKQDNSNKGNKGKSGLLNTPPTNKGATIKAMAAPMNSNIAQQCINSQQAQQHDQTVSMMSEAREILYGQQCSVNLNEQHTQRSQYGQCSQGNVITQHQNSLSSVPIQILGTPDEQARQFQQQQMPRCQTGTFYQHPNPNQNQPPCLPPTYEQYKQTKHVNNGNSEQCTSQEEAPQWVAGLLKHLDTRLQSIESQLSNQNTRWQQIDSQIQNQNKRLSDMEQKFSQFNCLQQTISQVENNVLTVNNQVSQIKSNLSDYEQSVAYVSDTCDLISSESSENKTVLARLCKTMDSVELKCNELQAKQQNTDERLTELQWRSMRDNLLFTGIAEDAETASEDVKGKLRDFVRTELGITESITFDRAHRIGKNDSQQSFPRPIVAKFHSFQEREMVRWAAPAALRGTRYGVREQFPAEIESVRKTLYPVMKAAKANKNNKVRLVRDKLFINNVRYIPSTGSNDNLDARPKTHRNNYQHRDTTHDFRNNHADNTYRHHRSRRAEDDVESRQIYNSRHVYASRTQTTSRRNQNENIWSSTNIFASLAGVTADEPASTITPKGSRKKPATSPLENECNKKSRDDISNSPIPVPPSQESMETQNLPDGESPNISIQCESNTQFDLVNNDISAESNGLPISRDNADDRNSVSSQ